MTNKTLKALKDSIKKWEQNEKIIYSDLITEVQVLQKPKFGYMIRSSIYGWMTFEMSTDTCALCDLFFKIGDLDTCTECPVYEKTEVVICGNTPWDSISGAFEAGDLSLARIAVTEQVQFLKSLLPGS